MEHVPSAAWNSFGFNRTVNRTHRRLVMPMSFVFPGAPVIVENIPALVMPKEINVEVRLLWFYEIKELVNNRESLIEIIRQCISWMREGL